VVAVQLQGTTVEQKLARIASASHGVVTRAQVVRAGITAEQVKQRLRGALLREHPAQMLAELRALLG
jgi:hypothetical protein